MTSSPNYQDAGPPIVAGPGPREPLPPTAPLAQPAGSITTTGRQDLGPPGQRRPRPALRLFDAGRRGAVAAVADHRHLGRRRRVAAAAAAHDAVDHHHADARDVAELHALEQRPAGACAARGP